MNLICSTRRAQAWDRRPTSLTWSSDGTALIVTADQGGRAPVFVVELSTSTVTQLTDDDFAYADFVPRRRCAVRRAQLVCGAAASGAGSIPAAPPPCCHASTCQRCQAH